MRVLLVEDDTDQLAYVADQLQQYISDAMVDRITTESAFRARFESLAAHPPDVAIIDMMLRWADPMNYSPVPQDVKDDNGHYHAGFRCAERMRHDPRTKDVAVLIYSVLDYSDVAAELAKRINGCRFVRKERDVQNLADEIRSLGVRR